MNFKRNIILVSILSIMTGCSITKTTSILTPTGFEVIKKKKLGLTGWKEIEPDK